MLKSKFEFCDVPAGLSASSIVIRDIGCRDGYASITNDAEAVVQTLLRITAQLNEPVGVNQPEIYCYDSNGQLDQLEHDGVEFTTFGSSKGDPDWMSGVKSHGRD